MTGGIPGEPHFDVGAVLSPLEEQIRRVMEFVRTGRFAALENRPGASGLRWWYDFRKDLVMFQYHHLTMPVSRELLMSATDERYVVRAIAQDLERPFV